MRIEDDLKEIKEEDLLEREPWVPPWVRKAFIILVAVFSILLMLSYAYLNYPVFGTLMGQLGSRPVVENQLSLGNVTISFSDEALSSLEGSYNSSVETSRCLEGEVRDGIHYIDRAYTPTIYSQSYDHVTFAPCSEETVILLHTHPYKSCTASQTDLNTLDQNQRGNPETVMVIMCEPNRYAVYR